MDYLCFGERCDYEGAKKAFSVDEYVELILYECEMGSITIDALSAVEGRAVGYLNLYDFSKGNITSLMTAMECEVGVGIWGKYRLQYWTYLCQLTSLSISS